MKSFIAAALLCLIPASVNSATVSYDVVLEVSGLSSSGDISRTNLDDVLSNSSTITGNVVYNLRAVPDSTTILDPKRTAYDFDVVGALNLNVGGSMFSYALNSMKFVDYFSLSGGVDETKISGSNSNGSSARLDLASMPLTYNGIFIMPSDPFSILPVSSFFIRENGAGYYLDFSGKVKSISNFAVDYNANYVPPTPVPVAASGLFLLSALGFLACFRKRKTA